MIRGLLFCATICSISTPVLADDRDDAAAVLNAASALMLAAPASTPARRTPIIIASDFTVTIHGGSPATVSLADFDDLDAPRPMITEQATVDLPFAVNEVQTLKAWRVGQKLPAITATANGVYAVRDALGQFRKPRLYRPTAFSTMLVLKIDGKDDTAPFSVGGGGVAAALWKASNR